MCSANVTAYRHPSPRNLHTHTRCDIADSDRRLGLVAIFQLHAVGLGANQCNSYTRSIAIHRLCVHIYYYLFLSTSIFIFIRNTNYGFNSGCFFSTPFCFAFVGTKKKQNRRKNNSNRQPVEYAKELKWTWNVVKMTNECNLFRCAAFDIYFSDAHRLFIFFIFDYHLAQQFSVWVTFSSHHQLRKLAVSLLRMHTQSNTRSRNTYAKLITCERPEATSPTNVTSYSNHVRECSQVDNINCMENIKKQRNATGQSTKAKTLQYTTPVKQFSSQKQRRSWPDRARPRAE